MVETVDCGPAEAFVLMPAGSPFYAPVIDGVSPLALLETKGGLDPGGGDATGQMIAAMMDELRQQFEAFQRIRIAAEAELAAADGDGRLARADLKAATDALSLIVRTIEKLDALEKSLAEAGARAKEEFSDEAYDALVDRIEREIGERALERQGGSAAGPPTAADAGGAGMADAGSGAGPPAGIGSGGFEPAGAADGAEASLAP